MNLRNREQCDCCRAVKGSLAGDDVERKAGASMWGFMETAESCREVDWRLKPERFRFKARLSSSVEWE